MLRIVTVYPDLLGTYGDRGNGLVLERRGALRGLEVELSEVPSDAALPRADLYCLGGGEDGPQQLAVERLERDGGLRRDVEEAVPSCSRCAQGSRCSAAASRAPAAFGARASGSLASTRSVARQRARWESWSSTRAEPPGSLTGFENHAGHTIRDERVAPLGRVAIGVGNGDGTDGVLDGRIVATYLHGPVLARNPVLADLLLALALDVDELAPLDRGPAEELHDERLTAVRRRLA